MSDGHNAIEGTATDPVCGMSVKMDGARFIDRHEGGDHYFCSSRCLDKFRASVEVAAPCRGPSVGDAKEPPRLLVPAEAAIGLPPAPLLRCAELPSSKSEVDRRAAVLVLQTRQTEGALEPARQQSGTTRKI